jgi:hypothetical protein
MSSLISPYQSAFIKGRTIYENFLYVRNIVCRFHRIERWHSYSSLTSLNILTRYMGLPDLLIATMGVPTEIVQLDHDNPVHLHVMSTP